MPLLSDPRAVPESATGETSRRGPSILQRLRPPMPSASVGWGLVLLICGLALLLRLWGLGYPDKLVFDETYYAKDAWSVLHFGYERNWAEDANDQIVAGNIDQMTDGAAFVVHPPVGKLLIGLGEWMFGMNSFGWRVMPAVFGTVLIGASMLLARRLSRSNLVAALTGILLTVDGLEFTMSRLALLDIFQSTFLVAAVAALVRDRDWFRGRLADRLEASGKESLGGAQGPIWWWRPWRILAGVLFGLSIGTKWNSIYALAGFALLGLAWDIGARRIAGARRPALISLLPDGVVAFVHLVVIAAVTYVATWTRWLVSAGGWDRSWAIDHPDAPLSRMLPHAFASLVAFHRDIYAFHTGEYIRNATHPYAADPWGWLILQRPTAMDSVNGIAPGTDGCPADAGEECLRVITSMGTPLLWWGAAIALVAAIGFWIALRDWRFSVPVVGALTMWLPWFQYTDRPLFAFYAICIVPFTVIALALCLGKILGPADGGRRRMIGAVIVGTYVALVVINFAWFYPIYTDEVLLHSSWYERMWFTSWI